MPESAVENEYSRQHVININKLLEFNRQHSPQADILTLERDVMASLPLFFCELVTLTVDFQLIAYKTFAELDWASLEHFHVLAKDNWSTHSDRQQEYVGASNGTNCSQAQFVVMECLKRHGVKAEPSTGGSTRLVALNGADEKALAFVDAVNVS